MAKLTLGNDGINTVLYLLAQAEDSNNELSKAQKKLQKQCSRALKRITISSAKGKGRGLQKWLCKRISDITVIPYDQQDDSCLIHSREMGQSGTDIILRGVARKAFPFTVECKSSEGFNLLDTIEQVKANLMDGTDWLVVYKRKCFKSPIVILDWDVFEKHMVALTRHGYFEKGMQKS